MQTLTKFLFNIFPPHAYNTHEFVGGMVGVPAHRFAEEDAVKRGGLMHRLTCNPAWRCGASAAPTLRPHSAYPFPILPFAFCPLHSAFRLSHSASGPRPAASPCSP